MRSYFVFAAMLIFSVVWPYIKLLMMVFESPVAAYGGVRGVCYVWCLESTIQCWAAGGAINRARSANKFAQSFNHISNWR